MAEPASHSADRYGHATVTSHLGCHRYGTPGGLGRANNQAWKLGNRNNPNREFLFPGDDRGFHHLLKPSQNARYVSVNNDPIRLLVHHKGNTSNLRHGSAHDTAFNYAKNRTRSGRTTLMKTFDRLTNSSALALIGVSVSTKRVNCILSNSHNPSQNSTKRSIEVRQRIHKRCVRTNSRKPHDSRRRSQLRKQKFQPGSVFLTADVKLSPSCVTARSSRRRVHAKSPTEIDARTVQLNTGGEIGLNNKDKQDNANLRPYVRRAKPVKWFTMTRDMDTVDPLIVEV